MKGIGWQEGAILTGFSYLVSWVVFAFGMAAVRQSGIEFFGYLFNPWSLLYALIFWPHIFFLFVLGFGGISVFSKYDVLIKSSKIRKLMICSAGIMSGFLLAVAVILPAWLKTVWQKPWSTIEHYANLFSHHFSSLLDINAAPLESGFIVAFWMIFGGLIGWLLSHPIPARVFLTLSIFISLIARCWVLYA